MTRKEFDMLWVGSIVHLHDWPYRVVKIFPSVGKFTLLKMPEVPGDNAQIRKVGYRKFTYVPSQKPPPGHNFWEEEDAI